jgi:hypothetical protein
VHILDHSSILKIEAVCSSETSSDFFRSTRRHTPEDSIVQVVRISEVSRIIYDVKHRKEGINIVKCSIVAKNMRCFVMVGKHVLAETISTLLLGIRP